MSLLDLTFWQQHTAFFYFLAFLLNLCIGSFLNVVIYRLPKMLDENQSTFNLAWPSSLCFQCHKAICWYDNLPVISYFLLKGRCRFCQQPFSWRYPLIEALTAVGACLLTYYFGINTILFAAWVMFWLLLAMTIIDLDEQLLPDSLTLSLLWLGLLFNLNNTFCSLNDAVIGAVIGYLSLWLVNMTYRLVRKRDGMGYGDFKLFAALGAWFGWQSLPIILFVAALVGSLVGAALMLTKKGERFTAIPFGPFLAIAAMVVLVGYAY